MARVLALTNEMSGCTLWRVLLPFTELRRQGYKGIDWGQRYDPRLGDYLLELDYQTLEIKKNYDAVILPRAYWPIKEREKAHRWFEGLHKSGIAIIYEIDDDHFSDEFVHRAMDRELLTKEIAEERRDCAIHTLKNCDGVTVSSQRLATMTREYTDKPVRVVPNFIDTSWFHEFKKKLPRTIQGLTIGWGGSYRPNEDLEILAEAWGRIAKKYPKVNFLLQGKLLDIFYDRVPAERITRLNWLPVESYPSPLVNVDIGCCPLPDTKFNRAKTYIKALEYGMFGAAVVASPTVYGQIIEHGKDGFIATTVDEWEHYLSMLIENDDLRHNISRSFLGKIYSEHSLSSNAWRWVEAWDSIIQDFRQRQRHKILLPREVMYA